MMTLTLPDAPTRRQYVSPRRRRNRPHVTMPEVDTYSKYVNSCIRSYQKLELGRAEGTQGGPDLCLPPCGDPPSTPLWPALPHPGLPRYNTSLGTTHGQPPALARYNSNLSTQSLPALGTPHRHATVVWAQEPPPPTAGSEASGGGSSDDGEGRMHITPDVLRQMLRERGLGDPHANASPRFCAQEAPPVYKKWMRETVMLQEVHKFRSRARLDYEVANAKAMAFCEAAKVAERKAMARKRKLLLKTWEQGVLQIETLSITDSDKLEEMQEVDLDGVLVESVGEVGGGVEVRVSEDKGPTPLEDRELNRIRTWLANCQQAAAKGHSRRGNNMWTTRLD